MKAIIKRELKNYFKNPIYWAGILILFFGIYQQLSPYLQLGYIQSEQEIPAPDTGQSNEPPSGDTDITEGYVPATEQEKILEGLKWIQKELVNSNSMTEQEAKALTDSYISQNMTADQIIEKLEKDYGFLIGSSSNYFDQWGMRPGNMEQINQYLNENFEKHSYSHYIAMKYADFASLYLLFFATVLLAFLFIRDTHKDTYELLHTKPVTALSYLSGKILGGAAAMTAVLALLTAVFTVLTEIHGRSQGFPTSPASLAIAAVCYILPNILMINCVYAFVSLLFHTPLPAAPLLFLYMIYSNMGSYNAEGVFGYYGRPLAIMVRFPGNFFSAAPPQFIVMNQIFLFTASALIFSLSLILWKRRRVL